MDAALLEAPYAILHLPTLKHNMALKMTLILHAAIPNISLLTIHHPGKSLLSNSPVIIAI